MNKYIISYNSPDEQEIFTGVAVETPSGAFLIITWDNLIPLKYNLFKRDKQTLIAKSTVEESSLFTLKPANV